MKIERKISFSPVSITLETQEEVTAFVSIMRRTIDLYSSDVGLKENNRLANQILNSLSIRI